MHACMHFFPRRDTRGAGEIAWAACRGRAASGRSCCRCCGGTGPGGPRNVRAAAPRPAPWTLSRPLSQPKEKKKRKRGEEQTSKNLSLFFFSFFFFIFVPSFFSISLLHTMDCSSTMRARLNLTKKGHELMRWMWSVIRKTTLYHRCDPRACAFDTRNKRREE